MSNVLCETLEPGIALVTLNRPEARNAMSAELLTELSDTMSRLGRDRAVRVAILNGAGRGFCAGADLVGGFELEGTEGMSPLGQVYRFQEHVAAAVLAIHECEKPVIAAVHGAAVGGGLAAALACDLRIAADSAKFGSVFIKVGLSSCDVGTSYFLPRLVGPGKAFELMSTGRHFGAEEAERIGLVQRVVPEGQEVDAALEIVSG